jgi:hypothetical protein
MNHEQNLSLELSPLNPELAARIAEHFQIDVYGVRHGNTAEQLAAMIPGADPSHLQTTATDKQRAITQALAETLGPNDILFREAYGYKEQSREIVQSSENQPTAERRRMAKKLLAEQQQEHDAISYAAIHALINGTRVMYADLDATQKAMHEASGTEFSSTVEKDRQVAGLNTIINYAVDHLPPEGEPVPDLEKRPHLMLLYGGAHIREIQELVNAANLPISTHTTEETQHIVERLMVAHLGAAARIIVDGTTPNAPNSVTT